ncbi:MAG: DMT family transporter [Pseudomonadota bacterium]|nr:DMT family transporter [Pseudomonadota bacterium]
MADPSSQTAVTDADARKRILSGYALLVLAVLMWAGNSTVGRATADENIPPMAFTFWRWVTAFLIFATIFGARTWRQRHEILVHWKFVASFALISVAGFNAVFYVALQKAPAVQVSLIQSILPVLVLLIGLAVLRERIEGKQWLGIVFSMGGAILIVTRGDIEVLQTLQLGEGDIWALGAVFIWAWQAFLMRWKPQTIDIMPFMTTIALIGVVGIAPLYLYEHATVGPMPLTQNSVLFVLYVAVMASFIGTTCWNEGTYRAGPARAGYFGNLFFIFASALAIVILGEDLFWYHIIGAACVLVGIWLATFRRDTAPAKAEPRNG